MGIFNRKNEKVPIEEKTAPYEGSDSSGLGVTGTISKEDLGDQLTNVGAGIIASHDDDKHSRNLPYLQYVHYASIQRDFENRRDWAGLEAEQTAQLSDPHSNLSQAKLDSQKALRRANFFAVFFLITTDILGPTNAPYAIGQLGLVPGVILYVAFGLFAVLGGYLLNVCFCKMDSNNFPLRTYADIAGRIFGGWSRYFIAGLQFVQMILNVGLIILTSGQALAQMIKSTAEEPKLCFSIQVLVWALLGMIIGQIRSLRDFSYIANAAVWMNIAICIITMVGVAKGPPNFEALINGGLITPMQAQEPIRVEAWTNVHLMTRIQGVSTMVFAWGGATIFCEVMAEMRRPQDFVKGMLGAQTLIMIVYITFGIFVYCYQGQFVDNPANQGISQYGLQTAGNILSLISGILAGALYGNVGLKVLYQGYGVTDWKFPALDTRPGILLWGILVVVYWALAFIIGSAIPQVSNLTSFVGALCILNFSYTLPAFFMLGMMMKDDAAVFDEYHPEDATVTAYDKWTQWSRWSRAMFGGGALRVFGKLFFLVMALASLCTSALGMYGSIMNMVQAYSQSSSTSFGCKPTA